MTIIKKFETIEEKNKIHKKYIVLTIISLFTLILIEIWVSNTVIAYGDKYEKLSVLEKNLRMENQILENQISENSSLKTIASKSAELGFSTLQGIQYIR